MDPVQERAEAAIRLGLLCWNEQDGDAEDIAPVAASFYEHVMAGNSVADSVQAAQLYFQARMEERAKPKEPKKKVRK